MGKIKIYLIDDHQIVIDGLLAVLKLEKDFEVVGYSLNATDSHKKIKAKNTDVLILDINMPDVDGIELLKEFERKGMPCNVIVLSSHDEIKIIKEVLKLGAKGYLSKSYAGENIANAVRKVYYGHQYFSESVKEKMLVSFTTNGADEDTIKSITKRELEILQLVVKEYTTKQIGEKLFISNNTVDTHRKNIMRKLEVKNTVGLVKYALKNELV
jgi:DNA-binding NarL/FixJ family response regulator